MTGDGFTLDDPVPYHDVEMKIEHDGYLPIEIKFELQDNEITKLIMGERLYGDDTACIRELLQNAVDTCREAREVRPATWEPDVQVSEDKDGLTLEVSDNGMGMDVNIIRQYFAKVGVSYYRSDDFKGKFQPIGEFGIGILSCFMLADRIEVDSLREGCDPIFLELRNLTEPFVPSLGNRKKPGTTVRLHLREDKVGSYDLVERVRHFARHIEFPISVTPRTGKNLKVRDHGSKPKRADLAVAFEDLSNRGARVPSVREATKLHVVCREVGLKVGVTLLPIDWRNFVSRLPRASLSQQGFFVGAFGGSARQFAENAWLEIELSGEDRLDLTADRTRTSSDNDAFWLRISELYSEAAEKLNTKWRADGDSPATWWRFHQGYYDSGVAPVPSSLKRSAMEEAIFCTSDSHGYQPMGMRQLQEWKPAIYWVDVNEHYNFAPIWSLLPPEAGVFSLPGFALGGDRIPWYLAISGVKPNNNSAKLLRDLGIRIETRDILGMDIRFVDAGKALGPLDASQFDSSSDPYEDIVYDRHHPFSQLLLALDQSDVPDTSRESLESFVRLIKAYTPKERLARERELLDALVQDGVINATDRYAPVLDEFPGHTCPYFEAEA